MYQDNLTHVHTGPLATEYPEFSKIRARRDRKRRNLIKRRKEEAAERLGLTSAEAREL
jgi:hypothetical protein